MEYSYTSPDSPKAKYNIIKNNCHTFALILLSDIMCFEIKTSCMTESDVFAGCKKMGLMSGVNNVSRMITKVSSSMNPYLPGGVLDIESNSWRGPYLSEQSHSRPDYRLGAVMKEKSKRQAAGLRYWTIHTEIYKVERYPYDSWEMSTWRLICTHQKRTFHPSMVI